MSLKNTFESRGYAEMLLGELKMRCGECSLIDHCDEPFSDIAICTDVRLKDVEEEKFLNMIEISNKRSKKARINDAYKKLLFRE